MMCRFEVNNYSIISHNLLCKLLTSYFNESNLDWNILLSLILGILTLWTICLILSHFAPKFSTLNFCDTNLCFSYFSKAFKSFKVTYHISLAMENDHLIEFQLIEIVFYHLIEIMLITWSNFTWSNQLIEILKSLKYHY